MNRTWGYNENDNNYKSTKTLVRELVKVVSRDGNYLLNIGPKGDGTVPEQTEDTLKAIGKWMDSYGESIYGTTRSPFAAEPEWGFYTKKEGKLFAHVFSWPQDEMLLIPALKNSIAKIYLMNKPGKRSIIPLKMGVSGFRYLQIPRTAMIRCLYLKWLDCRRLLCYEDKKVGQ